MPRFERSPSLSGPVGRRLLVVASQTSVSPTLLDEVQLLTRETATAVLVVAPVLPLSRLSHWCNDDAAAEQAAASRLRRCLDELRRRGVTADGHLGDCRPLTAIEDALATFPADEILVSTLPEPRSHWLEKHLIWNVRVAFGLPVTHVVAHEPAVTRGLAALDA